MKLFDPNLIKTIGSGVEPDDTDVFFFTTNKGVPQDQSYGMTWLAIKNMLRSKLLVADTEPGTVGAATVTAVTTGDGKNWVTTLTLTDFVIGALAGAAAALGVGNIVWAFPAGVQLEDVIYSNLGVTATGTAVTPVLGIGSVIASGAVAVLSGTATFQDYQAGYAVATTATHAAVANGPVGATAGIHTGIALQTAAKVKNLFLNAAATWNANNTGNLTASGTIVIKWTSLS